MRPLLADSSLCSAFDSAMLSGCSSLLQVKQFTHTEQALTCAIYTQCMQENLPDLFPYFREKFPGENLRARLCHVKVLQEGLSGEGVYILEVESSNR